MNEFQNYLKLCVRMYACKNMSRVPSKFPEVLPMPKKLGNHKFADTNGWKFVEKNRDGSCQTSKN